MIDEPHEVPERFQEGVENPDWMLGENEPGSPSYRDDDYDEYELGYQPKPTKAKLTPEEKIEEERALLFRDGSLYQPTQRHEIVGIDNVLREIDTVIHWLQYAKDYQRYDARLEPGIIFEGDPGTGKTLVSRYIATQSNALFVNVRDFPIPNTLFKGSDIAALFRHARQAYKEGGKPVILFWDEFEGAAIERGQASAEQGATVSQLTAELDGIHGKNEGILLIGCTNYIYGIDHALKRSGRMGLQIEFSAPDRAGKQLLLEYYLNKFRIKGKIDVEMLSHFFESTNTAADIEEAVVEAWRNAAYRSVQYKMDTGRTRRPALAEKDLVEVFTKRLVGPPSTFITMPREDRLRIAIHESGHALMALVYGIPLRLVTVQPGKKSLGKVVYAEVREHIGTMDEWMAVMRVTVGSIVAEQEANVPALVGSTGDVFQINQIAARLVDMLYKGFDTRLFSAKAVAGIRQGTRYQVTPNVSSDAVAVADRDIKVLLDDTYIEAKAVMASIGSENIMRIAEELTNRITMTGAEFHALVKEIVKTEPEEFRP